MTTVASPFIRLATFAREIFKENVRDGMKTIGN